MPFKEERRMEKSIPLGSCSCKFHEPCTLGLRAALKSSSFMFSKIASCPLPSVLGSNIDCGEMCQSGSNAPSRLSLLGYSP